MTAAGLLPPERAGRPAPADIADLRTRMRGAAAAGAWATRRPAEEVQLAGRRALRFRPEAPCRGLVLALHGGGFRMGMPDYMGPLAEALADRCAVEVVALEYRLAPEAPFPAGLADALAALAALRAEAGDAPLLVCGDSAGGGLAAGLGVLAAAGQGPRIDGLVLLSPWLDLRIAAPSWDANAATDPMFSRAGAEIAAELYLQGCDPSHPLASPLLAPLAGYPPTLISIGTGEVLVDDATRFHARLVEHGVPADLCAVDGMDHVALVRGLSLPGAAETFAAVCAFVERIVAA